MVPSTNDLLRSSEIVYKLRGYSYFPWQWKIYRQTPAAREVNSTAAHIKGRSQQRFTTNAASSMTYDAPPQELSRQRVFTIYPVCGPVLASYLHFALRTYVTSFKDLFVAGTRGVGQFRSRWVPVCAMFKAIASLSQASASLHNSSYGNIISEELNLICCFSGR